MTNAATNRCPACGASLATRTQSGVEIDECPQCHGIWLDDDELRKIKDAADPNLNWLDFQLWKHKDRFRVSARPEICPRCARPMVAIDYDKTGVEVHYCTACRGVWLEGGALEKIIAALEHELDTMPAAQYLRATLKEAKDIVTGPEGVASEWRDFLTVMRLMRLRLFMEHPRLLNLILEAERDNPLR